MKPALSGQATVALKKDMIFKEKTLLQAVCPLPGGKTRASLATGLLFGPDLDKKYTKTVLCAQFEKRSWLPLYLI